MKSPWEIIADLESDNSRIFKESVIKEQATENNIDFFTGVRYALDSMITFGVKQIPHKDSQDGVGLLWHEFECTIKTLVDRDCTGNAARAAINTLMNMATFDQWNNWYRRILIKDLRCGVSVKTINNAVKKKYEQFLVPEFSCQLAFDATEHVKKLVGKKLLSNKLDGQRLLTIVYPNGKVVQYSRNGKEVFNFESIKNTFAGTAHNLTEPMVFDGELMSKSFQDLMKQVRRKTNIDTSDSILYLFDMIPLVDFERKICNTAQSQRIQQLELWYNSNLSQLPIDNVQILGNFLVDLDTTEGKTEFNRINEQAIELGYEGIMAKDLDAPYECKRSDAWLKLKPVITVDLEVVALEEGTGKNQGILGAFVCEGYEADKFIRVNVGSGFSDKQRNDYWDFKEEIKGMIVEVMADAITQSQESTTYSLRFPRFVKFRGFEPGEKI